MLPPVCVIEVPTLAHNAGCSEKGKFSANKYVDWLAPPSADGGTIILVIVPVKLLQFVYVILIVPPAPL